MMRWIVRLLVGAAGVLALLLAAQFWMNPAGPAAKLGLQAQGVLGLATIRADIAAFFAVAGVLSLAAVIRREARLMTGPLLLVGLALAGRIATVAVSDYSPEQLPPMVVEAVLLGLFALARRRL